MNNNIIDILKEQIETVYPYAVNLRRDLHKYPETAWLEARTTQIIVKELMDMGFDNIITGQSLHDYDSRLDLPSIEAFDEHISQILDIDKEAALEKIAEYNHGFTGAIAILNCGDGPVSALRVDIDALPVKETEDNDHYPYSEGFSSNIIGNMHACGHDFHTAIGLGIAKILSTNRKYLKGTIKIIFQPAEEGARGAYSIIKKGHLDDVDNLIGLHVNNYDPAFKNMPDIMIESNKTLATTKIDAKYIGKEAHAALSPESGRNALLCACNAVMNLYSISQNSSSDTRINVGILNAGKSRNLICPEATMKLEVRASTSEGNTYMQQKAEKILNTAAEMYGCICEITHTGYALCVQNDPKFSKYVMNSIKETGVTCEYHPEISWSASEDFSLMADHIRNNKGISCYVKIMGKGKYPLHDNRFDFPETAIRNAILGLSNVIIELNKLI